MTKIIFWPRCASFCGSLLSNKDIYVRCNCQRLQGARWKCVDWVERGVAMPETCCPDRALVLEELLGFQPGCTLAKGLQGRGQGFGWAHGTFRKEFPEKRSAPEFLDRQTHIIRRTARRPVEWPSCRRSSAEWLVWNPSRERGRRPGFVQGCWPKLFLPEFESESGPH